MISKDKANAKKNTNKNKTPQSQNDIPEDIGKILKKLRKEKGLEISDVAEVTRVSQSNIRAIEAADYEALPAETFTRGLVQIYAQHLGADGKQMAERFINERHRAQPQSVNRARRQYSNSTLAPKTFAEPTHVHPAAIAGVILLIISVLVIVFSIYTSWNPFRPPGGENNVQILQPPATEIFPGEMPPAVDNQGEAHHSEPPAGGQEGDSAPVPEAASAALAQPYTLTIHILKDTWVDAKRDDKQSVRFNLKSGEKQVVRAEKSLELIFEQADSAELQLNGVNIAFPTKTRDGKIILAIPGDNTDN